MEKRSSNHAIYCGIAIALACLVLPGEARGSSLTLDFDAALSGGLLTADYVESGMRMSVVQGHYDLADGSAQIDTFAGGASTVKFDRWGGAFDFFSLLIDSWDPHPDGLAPDELAYVTSSNGGYVSISNAGAMSFTGPLWSNVSWVELSVIDPNHRTGDTQQDNLVFDNIRYGVPEPSSVLLMSLGIIPVALANIRRKRLHRIRLR
jgi:hypothetical protein